MMFKLPSTSCRQRQRWRFIHELLNRICQASFLKEGHVDCNRFDVFLPTELQICRRDSGAANFYKSVLVLDQAMRYQPLPQLGTC